MRVMTLLLFFSLPNLNQANPSLIKKARELFYEATYDDSEIEDFLGFIQQFEDKSSPTIQGYQAMAYMLKSKNSWNPYHKFDYFQRGKKILEKAIVNDLDNIELRYLRLCVQSSVPGVLNYNQDVKDDQEFILSRWKSIDDQDLQNKIKRLLLDMKLI